MSSGRGLGDAIGQDEIVRLMDLSDEALLIELGKSAHGAFPQDALDRGAKVFARLRDAARKSICTNIKIKEISQEGDMLITAGAIADLLATEFHVVPAATVSVLLVRAGLADYCSAYWSFGAGNAPDGR